MRGIFFSIFFHALLVILVITVPRISRPKKPKILNVTLLEIPAAVAQPAPKQQNNPPAPQEAPKQEPPKQEPPKQPEPPKQEPPKQPEPPKQEPPKQPEPPKQEMPKKPVVTKPSIQDRIKQAQKNTKKTPPQKTPPKTTQQNNNQERQRQAEIDKLHREMVKRLQESQRRSSAVSAPSRSSSPAVPNGIPVDPSQLSRYQLYCLKFVDPIVKGLWNQIGPTGLSKAPTPAKISFMVTPTGRVLSCTISSRSNVPEMNEAARSLCNRLNNHQFAGFAAAGLVSQGNAAIPIEIELYYER